MNADGVYNMKTCFKGNRVIFFDLFSSYDHLASVIRKVLEEKPQNVAGKSDFILFWTTDLTYFIWYDKLLVNSPYYLHVIFVNTFH